MIFVILFQNYRTKHDIYLRKLQTFQFKVKALNHIKSIHTQSLNGCLRIDKALTNLFKQPGLD